MEGKIFGIPLILILLVLAIVALIDVPMAMFHSATQKRLAEVQLSVVPPVCEPVATPSATPEETVEPTTAPSVAPKATVAPTVKSRLSPAPESTNSGE